MTGTVTSVKQELARGYDAAYACAPGCTCDNIMIEYTGVTRIQDDITASVLQLTETLKSLNLKQDEILTECEEYVEIDGNWYYDTADRMINPFEDTE